MADIFKSSTEAGQEVRSRGQTGIQPDPNSQALERLGRVDTPPPQPRLGIRPASPASADPSLIDAILQSYDNGTLTQQTTLAPQGQPNRIQQVLDAYDATIPSRPAAPTTPSQDVGFVDSLEKGAKGLKLTWDFLANKLETAVTGRGTDTAPILAKSVEEYKNLASDPRIQEVIQLGADAPGYYEGAKAMLKYAAQNPGMVVNFLGEQLPAAAASILPGGAVGLAARGVATRAGIGAAGSAATGTAVGGATLGASNVVLGALGTNYVEGLDKFNGDTNAASDYAATKTLAEVPANAVAGAFLAFNPLARFSGRAPITAATGNVAFQTGVQGAGGAIGAIQASEAVGEEINRGEVLAEALGGGITAPIDVAAAAVANRRGVTPPGAPVTPTPVPQVTVEPAPPQFDNAAPIDQAPQNFQRPGLTDPEFFGMQQAKDGPAFLASLYAQGDENSRVQLQNYADKTGMKLDLANASQNANLVAQGDRIVSGNPTFVGQFQERLGEFYQRTRPVDVPFDGGQDIGATPQREFIPTRERMRIAKDLADQGLMEQEGVFTRTKPTPKDEEDTQIGLDPTQSEIVSQNEQNREAETPIPSSPSPLTQLSQAEANVRQGLPVDTPVDTPDASGIQVEEIPQTAQIEAQGDAVVQDDTAPQTTPIVAPETAVENPAAVDLDFTTPAGDPDFARFQTEVSAWDNSQYKIPSKPTDYIQVNVDPDIKTLADALGIKVLGFRYIGKSQKLRMRYGMSNKEGAIALHDRAEDKAMFVFGHEVLHELASRNPADGKALVDEAIKYLSKEGQAAYKKKMKDLGYNPENVNEEAVADMMGLLFRDQNFWSKVNNDNPTLIRKILNVIEDLIAKFGAETGRSKSIAKYITDYEAVSNLLADFLKQQTNPEADLDFTQTTPQPTQTQADRQAAPTEQRVEAAATPSDVAVREDVPQATEVQQDALPQDEELTPEAAERQEQKRIEGLELVQQGDPRPIDVINADPNRVQRGTFNEQVRQKAPDIIEQERMAKQAEANQAARRREFEAEPFSDTKGIALVNAKLENDSASLLGNLLDAQGLVVGKVYETRNNGLFMIRNAKAGEPIIGSQANAVARISSLDQARKRGKEILRFQNQRQVAVPTQQQLVFSPEMRQKLNGYEAKSQRIMTTMFTPSTVQETLTELRGKLKDIFNRQRPFFKFNKKQSDVEYIFDQFAQVGAMEANARRANPVAAIAQAIERAQKQDVNARAGLFKLHAAKIADELTGLRQQMEADGFTADVIQRVVGDKIASLEVFEQADTAAQVNDAVGVVNEDTTQQEMTFPDQEQSLRIQAAMNAIDAIEESGGSDMSALWNEMRLPKGDREFQFSDFRKALAMRGKELSSLDREVSQFPAATTRLADFVFGNPKGQPGNYAARDAWVRSYEQIRNIYSEQPEKFAEFEQSLTDGEKRIVQYVSEKRNALKRRRQEHFDQQLANRNGTRVEYVNALYDDVKDAFPHALFNNYRLNELADPNTIPEGDRAYLEGLVYGELKYLHRLWLDDVTYAMDARKDLQTQIMSRLTPEERQAVIEYKNRSSKVILDNARRSDLRVYMSMLDYMQGLDPKAYAVFQNRVLLSDMTQVPSIIQEAEAIANLASLANNKNELISALEDHLAQVYKNDEFQATDLDAESDTVAAIDGQELPTITDEDIQAEIDRAQRVGEGYLTREDARISLLYKRIADAAAKFSEDGFAIEPAADAATQPENNVLLGGDVFYKRGKHSHGPAAATVTAHLAEITADWDVKPSYTVLMNPAQISDPEVRARILGRFESSAFKGAIDPETGQVYVFSQYLDGIQDAEFVLFHELYGHWGMRYFLGDRLNSFLETQYRLNEKVRNAADRQFQDAAASQQPMSRLESIEEAIADIAAKGDTSLFRELVGRLVDWLRKAGVDSVADWLDSTGDRQLAFVLSRARSAVRTQQGVSPLNGAPSEVLYARSKLPVEIFATRDGKTTGFARINPVTREWTVFTINEKDETFSATTVEEYDQAMAIIKKVGKPVRSTDRATRQEIDPADIKQVPDFSDVTGWSAFTRKLQLNIQNQYLPVFEVAEYLAKNGVENTVIQDLKLYEGRLKFFVDDMRKRYQEPIQKLLKTIGDKGGDIRGVDRFLLAQHAEERNKQINKINPTNFSGSGMSTQDARALLKSNNDGQWEPYRAELEEIGRLMDQMSTDHVNYMVQTGLIDSNTAEALNVYSKYRNLSGNEDLGLDKFDKSDLGPNGFNFKGREVQTATGRGTEPIDILQNTMNAYLSTLIRGQKARVNRSILQMLEQNPDPNFVQINPIAEKKRLNLDKLIADKKILKYIGDAPSEGSGRQYLEGLKKQIADGNITPDDAQAELINRIQLAEQQRMVEPADAMAAIRKVNAEVVISGRLAPDGYVTMVEDPNLIRDPNVLIARVDGKPILMRFTDRGLDFVQSISGANKQSRSDLVNIVGAWGRFFSQMLTSWNPAWVLPNGFRDAQTAFANASADPEVGPVLAAQMTKEWYPSLKVAFRYLVADQADTVGGWWGSYLNRLKDRKPLSDADRQLYEEFRRNGAETFFLDRQNVEETLESMNRHMNGPNGMLEFTKDKLEAIGKFMELLAMPIEAAPRFSMYKVLRQNGFSEERAATYAKEITVNFNMKGASQNFRALYVFANPAVQGTYRMFQNYSAGDKGFAKYMPSKQFAATAGVWIVMGIMGNMIARAIGGEDEEKPGVDKLDMIPNYKRATSLILAPDVPGGAIPIAYGWNVFHTIGHYMADVFGGKLKPEEAASRVLTAAMDSFAPIGSGAESQSISGSILKTFSPTIITPVIDIFANENRFGAPIYKEQNPFTDRKEANAYMHFDSVNPISKSLMQGLNNATGGDRYNKGLIDINPGAVDYFIQSYLPGLITEAYKGTGLAIQAIRGEDTKRAPLPLIDRLSARIPEGYDAGAMRRAAEVVETKYAEFMDPNTTRAEKAAILKQHPNLGAAKAVISGVDQQIKSLRQQLISVNSNPNLSEEYKVAARNRIKEQEKKFQNQAVNAAIRAGFRDAVISNATDQGLLNRAGNLVRGSEED